MAKIQLEGVLQLVDVDINPRVFKKISQATAGLPKALGATQTAAAGVGNTMQRVDRRVRDVNASLSQGSRVARQFLQRMAQFAVLLPTFATLNRAIQGGAAFIGEFETGLKNILRIDIAGVAGKLELVQNTVFEISREVGGAAEQILDTVRVFKQAGASIEESLDRARIATLATKTSTLELSEAQEVLIAVNEQFGFQGLSNIEILDKFAKVEDIAAVNAQDLAEALRTGGNALAFFTKDLNDTVGLIAALRQQTRKSGREVGTFFKTIATRLTAAGEARDAVEGFGVQVENLDGSLRPGLEILLDLKTAFDSLGEAEQASAAKAIAGVRQFESLLGVFNSLENAVLFSNESLNSGGTVLEKYAAIEDQLAIVTEKTVNKFKELAVNLGDAGLLNVFKEVVKFGGNVATILNQLGENVEGFSGFLLPLLGVGAIKVGQKAFGAGTAGRNAETTAIQANTRAFQQNTATILNQHRMIIGSTSRGSTALQKLTSSTGGLLVAAIASEAVFTALSAAVAGTGSNIEGFVDTLGEATTTGLQFALLGPKFGLAAAALVAIVQSTNKVVASLEDETKARQELTSSRLAARGRRTVSINPGDTAIRPAIEAGLNAAAIELAKSEGVLTQSVVNVANKAFSAAASKIDDKELREKLSGVDFGELLSDLEFIKNESTRGLEGPLQATRDLAGEMIMAGGATAELANALRTTFFQELGHTADGATLAAIKVREFFTTLENVGVLDSLRDANIAAIDSQREIARLTSESTPLFEESTAALERRLIAEREAQAATKQTIEDLIRFARTNPSEAGFLPKVGTPAADTAEQFIRDLVAVEHGATLSSERLQELSLAIAESTSVSNLAREVREAANSSLAKEVDISEALFNIREARRNQEVELMDLEQERADNQVRNANEAQIAFLELGASLPLAAQELEALKNLTLEDYKSILTGAQTFSDQIRSVVLTLGGDDIHQAQADLAAVTARSSSQLEVLTTELERVEAQLNNVQGGFDQTTGESRIDLLKEQAKLETEIAQAQLDAETNILRASQKVLEAQLSAEEDALKKTEELAKAMDALANAEKNLENELIAAEKSFRSFMDQKIANFASELASANENLANAEQEVIAAHGELSESYNELISAIIDYNDAVSSARIESNLLDVEIASLGGGLSDFRGRLAAINNAFTSVLNDANISLQKRIELERRLAEETLSFLRQTRDEIVSAGLQIFGQSAEENRNLAVGIDGLRIVADKLGGSFDNFLNLGPDQFKDVQQELLNLPLSLRQSILDALSSLPSTTNIGGFSPEQLETAIGQIGAGIAPSEGLPSVEELIKQETEQLEKLQDLALESTQLEAAQISAALDQVEIAKAQLEEAELLRDRALEELGLLQEAIHIETGILEGANQLRIELTDQLINANSQQSIEQIQAQASEFAKLNGDIGAKLVDVVDAIANIQIQVIQAAEAVPNGARGFIPNFARGNLSPREIFGLIRAAEREKSQMPANAGLAVANTRETIIPPNASKGWIPNYRQGSDIATGIDAIRGSNSTVIAAIARSISQALADSGSRESVQEADPRIIDLLTSVRSELEDINVTNTSIDGKTSDSATTGTTSTSTTAPQRIDIQIQANQNDKIEITGLENLADALQSAIRSTSDEQIRRAVMPIVEQLQTLVGTGIETGQLTSFGQGRA